MVDWIGEFSFFPSIHVRIDIWIDISIMTTKFGKQVHLEELTQLIKLVLVNSSREDHVTNLKKLYLSYQSAFVHQTRQDGNLPWLVSAYKFTWVFDCVALQDHVTRQNHYI